MDICNLIIFFSIICTLDSIASGQFDEDSGYANRDTDKATGVTFPASSQFDEDSRNATFMFEESVHICIFLRQKGFCRREANCSTPRRSKCKFGQNPVICCSDLPEERDTDKVIDSTFPGLRKPKVEERTKTLKTSSTTLSPRKKIPCSGATSKTRECQGQYLIFGGTQAKPHSWPWMVSIFIKGEDPKSPKQFKCGASLISKKYVLTAAHCCKEGNLDPSRFFVVVGTHRLGNGTEYPVEEVLNHPDYKRKSLPDMCLLRIKNEVKLSQKVKPVRLPSDGLKKKTDPGNKYVTITGFGRMSTGKVPSEFLKQVTLPILPLKKCKALLPKTENTQIINDKVFCTGFIEGGVCKGDSGSPGVIRLKDNTWMQIGIVSQGSQECDGLEPFAVHVNTSTYAKWIYDNTDLG